MPYDGINGAKALTISFLGSATMSENKVDTIRSSSSGVVGRAISEARGQSLVLDSSHNPNDDAFTNSEAFLASISSCGVTLIEGYAKTESISLDRMTVSIDGARASADPTNFVSIAMRFEFAGVDQSKAEELVRIWRER